jgi:hypothetical protein
MPRLKQMIILAVAAAVAWPANAQLTAPVKNGDNTIIVKGKKPAGGQRVEMSDWRMAETAHVVVFGKGDEKGLARRAHSLEKLHFLLSMLLGRVDEPDDTVKISVTMIGDASDFEQLRLTNLRWQYGPFPDAFPSTIYYDPREEGSVLATTATGVRLILAPSQGRPTNRNCDDNETMPVWSASAGQPSVALDPTAPPGPTTGVDLSQFPIGEVSYCQSPEARLYSLFAQNYLMTYFPAAYPRWYLQGFGEIFSTMMAGDGVVEYGRRPIGFQPVLERYGNYPVTDILNGQYLEERHWTRRWTPYHAWRLVHLLFLSEEWKQPLHNYLKAVTSGADPKTAMSAFGDLKVLQKAINVYRGKKVPFERLSFPADRVPPPTVRRLTRAEAGLIRGRLELGARIELPAEGARGRATAVGRRDAWLKRLRDNASRFPNLLENQLLLAEGECRTGNPNECLQAADRALAIAPSEITGLVWKGVALVQLAARAPESERAARVNEARAIIATANHADPDAILPLIAYSNSYAAVGEPAPDIVVDALYKIMDSSPAAPKSRLLLGEELVRRDLKDEAREILLPVAKGPFHSPEEPRAIELLQQASPSGQGR